jgi:MtrB/PioB family decaheme-associated outer membrane protein
MRTKLTLMAATLLLVSAAGARAQEGQGTRSAGAPAGDSTLQPDVPKTTAAASNADISFANRIDFGVRGTAFGASSDQARFQRYRDLRDGGTIDLFKFNKSAEAYLFNFQADHLGYRDQRYTASYNDYRRVKATFEWNQIPLLYSDSTATLYTSSTPGVLLLPGSVQSGIQNKTTTLPQAVTGASTFDTQSRRDLALFNVIFSATPNVDVGVSFKNASRNGTQPYAPTFGFGDAVEVPLPIDDRTTEMGASLQWSNGRGMAKLAYDGSFFRNNISTLTWANPQRITDSATAGPVNGRMSLWPNSNLNTGSALASVNLPGHSHASGYLSISNMTQNDPLIPFTINSALPTIALDRATANLTARVTAMNYSFTSRPVSATWLSLRYRQYQYDNRSPAFSVGQTVSYDTSVATLNTATELIGFTRRTFDADASYSPSRYVGVRAGYTREDSDHANPSTGETTRYLQKTVEDTGRLSMDLTGIGWLTLRGIYEHGKRVGSGLDLATLIAIGEQPSLRQFDVADRNTDSFRGIVQFMPVSQFSVNATAGVGREEYPGTNFGLRNNDNHVYSIGFDYVPIDAVSMGVTYGYERYTALQASRSANPLPANTLPYLADATQQFNDPRRDWTDASSDDVKTWNASIDLLKIIPKTDVRVGYDYNRANSLYVYGLATNTVLAAPLQLPSVVNQLQRGTADVRYSVTRHLVAGIVYWYDKYDVSDFALGPTASLASPATASATLMLLGYSYRPYTAQTFWGRLTYLW